MIMITINPYSTVRITKTNVDHSSYNIVFINFPCFFVVFSVVAVVLQLKVLLPDWAQTCKWCLQKLLRLVSFPPPCLLFC